MTPSGLLSTPALGKNCWWPVCWQSNCRLDIDVPEVLRLHRGERSPTPLFPGYLFIHSPQERPSPATVRATPGVIRLVSFGPEPQPVPTPVIDQLRKEVAALNDRGGLAPHAFHEGQRVRLTEGPLQGLEAVFEGPLHPSRRVPRAAGLFGSPAERGSASGGAGGSAPTPPAPDARQGTVDQGQVIRACPIHPVAPHRGRHSDQSVVIPQDRWHCP